MSFGKANPEESLRNDLKQSKSAPNNSTERKNLRNVRVAIRDALFDRSHDDGSLGPLMIRFSWHNCGTFDKLSGTGGSNGATMRFAEEQSDPENAGFEKALEVLRKIHEKFPEISFADLSVLAGTVAIEACGGPHIPFRTGRRDFTREEARQHNGTPSGCPFGDGKFNPHGSRLPAADLGPDRSAPQGCPIHVREKPTIDAIRNTFERMGFNDRETVCLIILGHQFGRCHPNVSGYEHPWYTFAPTHWNIYSHGLGYISAYGMARNYRLVQKRPGKRQFEIGLGGGEPFMMLVADMCLTWDDEYRQHLQFYDRNRREFREDAVSCWTKLIELGCEGLVPEL